MTGRLSAVVVGIRIILGTLYVLAAFALPFLQIVVDGYRVPAWQFFALVAAGLGMLALGYSLEKLFADLLPFDVPPGAGGANGTNGTNGSDK